MTQAEYESMQNWERLRHRIAVDYTRTLMHLNCWLASNRPYLVVSQ